MKVSCLPLRGLANSSPKRRGYGSEPALAVLVTLLLLFTGCQAVPPLPPVNLSEPGWSIRHGQAVWNPGKAETEIAGELLVAIHADGRELVAFAKPPVPIVTAQTLHDSWEVHFSPQDKTYSGRGTPPKRIVWLQLPGCLSGGLIRDPWEWQVFNNGSWRLQNKSTGESLAGFLKQ